MTKIASFVGTAVILTVLFVIVSFVYVAWRSVRGNEFQTNKAYIEALYEYDEAVRVADFLTDLYFFEFPIILFDSFAAQTYVSRGKVYWETGKYESALADFDMASSLNPSEKLAFFGRGLVYSSLHEYELALIEYDRLLELDPKYADAYNNRGIVNKEIGYFDEAISDYTMSIELGNSIPHIPYGNRGSLYFELGEYELAIADYSEEINLNEYDNTTYYYRGIAYAENGQNNLAIRDFETYLIDGGEKSSKVKRHIDMLKDE